MPSGTTGPGLKTTSASSGLVATMLSDAIDKVRIDRELIEAKDRAVAASKAKSQFLANNES